MGDDDKEIASTTVTKDDDGTIDATATTKDGSTGSGHSSEGLVSSANPEEAVKEAVEDAKS
jgi:hypothetical protein